MCSGAIAMAVASFAIGSAQSVMSYQGQRQAAASQNAYYEANAKAANQATVNSYAGLQNRALQERSAASQEKQNVQLEAMQGRSSAAVAAGEAGVSGLSVDALMGDFYGKQGRYERTLDRNYQMQADSIRSEMDATQAQGTARIMSVQKAQKPSFASAALGILGSGVGAYDQYLKNTGGYAATAAPAAAPKAAPAGSVKRV